MFSNRLTAVSNRLHSLVTGFGSANSRACRRYAPAAREEVQAGRALWWQPQGRLVRLVCQRLEPRNLRHVDRGHGLRRLATIVATIPRRWPPTSSPPFASSSRSGARRARVRSGRAGCAATVSARPRGRAPTASARARTLRGVWHLRRAGSGSRAPRVRPGAVPPPYTDNASAAAAMRRGPCSVSSPTIRANVGCVRPDTRNVHRYPRWMLLLISALS